MTANTRHAGFFKDDLATSDPEIFKSIELELGRQRDEIELIASENIVSRAVMQAQGSVMTNKYAEGYAGRRYYGGCQFVDIAENLAVDRAKELLLKLVNSGEAASKTIIEEVRSVMTTGTATSFHGLTCGPNIESSSSLIIVFFDTLLLMKIVAVRAVELLTGAYCTIFRADAF